MRYGRQDIDPGRCQRCSVLAHRTVHLPARITGTDGDHRLQRSREAWTTLSLFQDSSHNRDMALHCCSNEPSQECIRWPCEAEVEHLRPSLEGKIDGFGQGPATTEGPWRLRSTLPARFERDELRLWSNAEDPKTIIRPGSDHASHRGAMAI